MVSRVWHSVLLFLMVLCLTTPGLAQLVANPNDFKIEVKWDGGVVTENGKRIGGQAKVSLRYEPPSGQDISHVRAKLTGFNIGETYTVSPDFGDPPSLWQADPNVPTLLENVLDENGQPTSTLGIEFDWPTRLFHNGQHVINAGLDVMVYFVNGQTQPLQYQAFLTIILRNLTVHDLTGVAAGDQPADPGMLGEPETNQPVLPLATPAFMWGGAGSTPQAIKCVVNCALGRSTKLRYEILSCDNPDQVIVTHEQTITLPGVGTNGKILPSSQSWNWNGTYTVQVYDEYENYVEETRNAPRGLYQCRITAEIEEDPEGFGAMVVDSDCTRRERTRWPFSHWEGGAAVYSPIIQPVYDAISETGQRNLKITYVLPKLHPQMGTDAKAVRAEAFTRVYDGAPGAMERVGNVVNGPALANPMNPPHVYNEVTLNVPWGDKDKRVEKVLLTARDLGGYDRAHRELWNLGQTRKVIDGTSEMVIYRQVPATAPQPERLQRVNDNETIGGRCFVGIELELSAGARLTNGQIGLRLQEEPDTPHNVTHGETQNHVNHLILANMNNFMAGPGQLAYGSAAPVWEQWNESTQSWQASQGYPYGDSFHPTGSGRREYWRALIPWQTTQAFAWNTVTTQSAQDPLGKPYSTLLGHNGEHTLRVESFGNQAAGYGFNGSNVTFASWEEGYRTMTYTTPFLAATRPVKVKNLVITRCEAHDKDANGAASYNPDYIKFDPDSDDELLRQPKITFKIEDIGDPHRYRWTLKIKDTRTATYIDAATIKGTGFGAGTYTVTINEPQILANDLDIPSSGEYVWQDTSLKGWGTYSFDFFVKEFETDEAAAAGANDPNDSAHIDYEALRSPYKLQIPATYNGTDPGTQAPAPRPGHEVFWESDGESIFKARVTYYLTDSKDATQVKVDFLSPELGMLNSRSDLPVTVNTPHPALGDDAFLIHDFGSNMKPGTYIGLFMAEDAHAMEYRDHRNHRMLAINARPIEDPIELVSGFYAGAAMPWYCIWVKAYLMREINGGLNTPANAIPSPNTVGAAGIQVREIEYKGMTGNSNADLNTIRQMTGHSDTDLNTILAQLAKEGYPGVTKSNGWRFTPVRGAINGAMFDSYKHKLGDADKALAKAAADDGLPEPPPLSYIPYTQIGNLRVDGLNSWRSTLNRARSTRFATDGACREFYSQRLEPYQTTTITTGATAQTHSVASTAGMKVGDFLQFMKPNGRADLVRIDGIDSAASTIKVRMPGHLNTLTNITTTTGQLVARNFAAPAPSSLMPYGFEGYVVRIVDPAMITATNKYGGVWDNTLFSGLRGYAVNDGGPGLGISMIGWTKSTAPISPTAALVQTNNPAHVFLVHQAQQYEKTGGWTWRASANFMTSNTGPPGSHKPTQDPLSVAISKHWAKSHKSPTGVPPFKPDIRSALVMDAGSHADMVYSSYVKGPNGVIGWFPQQLGYGRGIGSMIEAFALR